MSLICHGDFLFLEQFSFLPCAYCSYSTPAADSKLLHSNDHPTLEITVGGPLFSHTGAVWPLDLKEPPLIEGGWGKRTDRCGCRVNFSLLFLSFARGTVQAEEKMPVLEVLMWSKAESIKQGVMHCQELWLHQKFSLGDFSHSALYLAMSYIALPESMVQVCCASHEPYVHL